MRSLSAWRVVSGGAIIAFMSHRIRIFITVFLCWQAPVLQSQEIPPLGLPDPVQEFAEVLQFDSPTRIEGRLLTFDTYDEAIWIEWTQWFQQSRWVRVKTETQLLIYPRDAGMMQVFRGMKPGTPLRMTIQTDKNGKRRVVDLDGT